jgi:deazaflavin-dependent oxidoreductase (nitroreductase family)
VKFLTKEIRMPTAEGFKRFNQPLIEEFRANKGKVSGWHSLLLLTTIGATSEKPHTTPLVYSIDGDRIIVVAAAAGAPKHPAWYRNLLVHSVATVELNGDSHRMRATVANGAEYERLFKQHTAQFPVVLEYQEKISRRIPIVILGQID